MKKTLFMETTQISVQKTSAEIQACLAAAGASQIVTVYGASRAITGMSFTLEIKGRTVPFAMPVRTEPIFKAINGRRSYPDDHIANDRAQSERVAWRQLLRWVQAQLALIDCGMVDAGEVFYPYVEVAPGVTMYRHVLASGGPLALPAPENVQ